MKREEIPIQMADSIHMIIQPVESHPVCEHGPALLFERFNDGECQRFFACSAYRDQYECSLHVVVDQNKSQRFNRDMLLKITEKSLELAQNQSDLLRKVIDQTPGHRIYCHDCHTFVVEGDKVDGHKNHTIQRGIMNEQLERPTTFLKSLSNDKREAQYFFSENSLNCFLQIFQRLRLNKIICIGAPRLHEKLSTNYSKFHIKSILLDLDTRFHSFFNRNGRTDFLHYNMFNNLFFGGQKAETKFQAYLHKGNNDDRCCIFTDPAFGCRTEPLIFTLHELRRIYNQINHSNEIMPIFWVFPYFMETYITKQMPEMRMIDYKIDYTNHGTYHSGQNGRKQGSPVRLFTNVSLHLIDLPAAESYYFCKKCRKWSAHENIHCDRCKIFPSKNGTTYIHCNLCETCVKPNYKHCKHCWRCTQTVNHDCSKYQLLLQCMICLDRGHNEINCRKWIAKCGKSAKEINRIRDKMHKTGRRICLLCFKSGHNEKLCIKRHQILDELTFLGHRFNILTSEKL